MMYPSPFYSSFYSYPRYHSNIYRKTNIPHANSSYLDYHKEKKEKNSSPKKFKDFNPSITSNSNSQSKKISESSDEEKPFFNLFGISLYFDDILLICLIFFLYQEGVKDQNLFLALILLLLS